MDKPTVAFNIYQQIVSLVKLQRGVFLDLGKLLKEVKDNKLYKQMGDGGFDSWKQFLANPEINFKPVTAEMYIRVYEFYILKMLMPKEEVMEIPLVRLNMMKAKIENSDEEERGELIEKAKILSYSDFMKEMVYHKVKTKPKFILSKCDKCGNLVIRYDPTQICHCEGSPNINEIYSD